MVERETSPTGVVRLGNVLATNFRNRGAEMQAIRFGEGIYPGLVVEKLFHDTLFPVCSPELLKGAKPLREPKDLAAGVRSPSEFRAELAHGVLQGVREVRLGDDVAELDAQRDNRLGDLRPDPGDDALRAHQLGGHLPRKLG